MSVELKVPSLGESVREATIEKWLKREGEFVKRDEPVVSLESDKANVEVPAPVGGILKAISKQAGAKVAIGEVLARIEPATMRLSRQNLAGVPVPATPEASAVLAAVTTPAGGMPRAQVTASPREAALPPGTAAQAAPVRTDGHAPATIEAGEIPMSPSLRKMAREHGIDPAKLQGSGPGGRVLPADVQREVDKKSGAAPAAAAPAVGGAPLRREERVAMTGLRKRIAQRLVEGRNKAAILTTFNECDMSRVMALREEHKAGFEKKHGVKLGFMSFFVKATIEALKAYPLVNAQIENEEVVYRHYYDIGVAVGGGRGLVVPVIRNAELLSFAEVEKKIVDFGTRAKDNKLMPDELSGGTFTISNGGVYGSLLSTPLLNTPQTGILGMHSIQKRPVVVSDQVVVRPMMYLALSYDHRLIDGREAVLFLVKIKECIESPDRILLEV